MSSSNVGLHYTLSREELLLHQAPMGMTLAYRHLEESRARLGAIFQGKDSQVILRRIREWSAQQLEASLRAGFDEAESAIPLALLAQYLAGAQIGMIDWWLERRQPYSAEELAQTIHRLQRAAIRAAFGLTDA